MSNPFQPYKPHPNFFNASSGNYMQNLYHSIPQPPQNVQNFSTATGVDQVTTTTPQIVANTINTCNKGGPTNNNYHKINNLDKMVGLDNLVEEQIGDSAGMSRDERNFKLRQFAEKNISDGAKQQILHILEKISQLSPLEKLLLYLRLPGGYPETDPLRQSQNPLGSRSEINHTINWVKSHLEMDEQVSIPKQDVYDDYVAYCGRVSIKPLSTADFGKVMKQVFPNIRPRRLGTRGNSRYCYAAMRKATKLDCPILPEIIKTDVDAGFNFQQHENSWRTVKSWAESLLTTEFDCLEELADHIDKQHLNSPASISSRQMLQKKLLQKEIKERKKINEAALKKRRKKRRKISSLCEPTQSFDSNHSTKFSPNTQSDKSPTADSGSQVPAPIKLLKTEADSNDYGTNLSCDKPSTTQTLDEPDNNTCPGDKTPEIVCKKVRATRFAQPQLALMLKRASTGKEQNEEKLSIAQQQLPENDETKQETMRLKKIRLAHRTEPTLFNAQQNVNSNFDTVTEPDQDAVGKLPDLPLPRERVISLCKMDKNELNDYLPNVCNEEENEDNSQEPDSELLQIFQTEGKAQAENRSSIPVLENYQLYSQNQSFQMRNSQQRKFAELRNILEQNLQQPQMSQNSMHSGNGPEMEASNTLTMMSERHTVHQHTLRNFPVNDPMSRKNIPQHIPPSPHVRKNFTFVPISAGSGTVNAPNAVQTSPFVSPRTTPIAKYKRINNLAPLQMACNQNEPKMVPTIGAQNTAFSRAIQFKQELPASAPSSPSLGGTFRYYSGQPANTASTIYPAENRSQSVPLHQQPQDEYSCYSSACNSVNPTPVPSEFRDFDEQSSLLEMFSADSGAVPNIKMETNDLMSTDFLDHDEVSQDVSCSVPSTPISCVNNFQKQCNGNDLKAVHSASNTPVAQSAFCFTPPPSRDYLINGYSVEQKQADSSNQSYEQQQNVTFTTSTTATSSFMPSDPVIAPEINNYDTNSNHAPTSDQMMGSEIFNQMS